jgi:hypothetical protein
MAICKDCIEAVRAGGVASPCEGYYADVLVSSISIEDISVVAPFTVKENLFSLIGYDYTFSVNGVDYTMSYANGQWIVLNERGDKVFFSTATGDNNNLCPPRSGWTNINGEFISFEVGTSVDPTPSNSCLNSNGTFDTNSTGWSLSNTGWSAEYGGAIKYDSSLLGSLSQLSILTIGETYSISVDYISPVLRGVCSPDQYDAAFIKIYAGTNVFQDVLQNTFNNPNYTKTVTIELTCEGNTNFKVEVQDPNNCYGTVTGQKAIFIDNICIVQLTNNTDPVGEDSPLPSVEYRDMAEVPAQLFGRDYNTVIQYFQDCLATKGTAFYNKIVGAVTCDDRELQKLKLIVDLLGRKDEYRSLDCIYDRLQIPTSVYPPLPSGNLPVITQNQTEVVISGDLSQFEGFSLHIEAATDYGVVSGIIVDDTDLSAIYVPVSAIPFPFLPGYTYPIGFSFSLLNNLGDYYSTAGTNTIATVLYSQPGPPVNTTLIPVGTIGTHTLFTVANGTIWTLYEPITATTTPVDFTTTIVDAVYDVISDTTTILMQDPMPGIIGGATYTVEHLKEETNDYLETFLNFANRMCADCIVTPDSPPSAVAPLAPGLKIKEATLTTETGIVITTQFNQKITIK